MDAKEAVALAKQHIQTLFANEGIVNVGLEEVEFDRAHQAWNITIGFSRPWDVHDDFPLIRKNMLRTYKKVVLSNQDQSVLSVKNRDVAEA